MVQNMDKKIDLVYLWVDGNDKKWREAKKYWQEKESGTKKLDNESICEARWRDNDEFKYSMRSVAKFAPWINHIYIITCMGQRPKWLNTKNKKISVIDHTQIMPPDALPCFNSKAIESCIINIPNLSEFFIYSNDDMFFGRPLTPDYFFDKNDNPIVRICRYRRKPEYSMYHANLCHIDQLCKSLFGTSFPTYNPNHNIEPYRKSHIKNLISNPIINLYYQSTIRTKFRNEFNLQRWMFSLFDIVCGNAVVRRVHAPKTYSRWLYNFIHKINGDFKYAAAYTTNALKSNLLKHRPALFCINDVDGVTDADRIDNLYFLELMFPEKCEFEK